MLFVTKHIKLHQGWKRIKTVKSDKTVLYHKFFLPTDSSAKNYIDETIRLMNELLQNSPMKDIFLKTNMLILNLAERRLDLWNRGEHNDLFLEEEATQMLLKSIKKSSSIAEISKKVKDQMPKGNLDAAIHLLTYGKWKIVSQLV